MANDKARARIEALEDELKQRDRRIVELKQELDEQRDLIRRFEEHAEDYTAVLERWKETFDMTETENGAWTWAPFWKEWNDLVVRYNERIRKWNKAVPLLNRQPVGRPLAANEAQCATVRKLRKAGRSLRTIAEETNLGINTVRTIVDRVDGSDRTSIRHRERIEIDQKEATTGKRRKRIGDALPRQAQAVVERGRALLKEAKGLGR
jgi:helix-turn-helix resolvase-like protein